MNTRRSGSRLRTLLLAAAMGIAAVACGGGDGGSGAPPAPNVTPAGGTVVSDDGKVQLIVPAGAISTSTHISIEKTDPDTTTAADPLYLAGSSYRIVGDLGTLAQPAIWELALDTPLAVSTVIRAQSATPPVSTGHSCNASDGRPIGYEWVIGSSCPSGCRPIWGASPFIGNTYTLCVPATMFWWDRTAPYCENDPPHPNGLINTLASREGNEAVYDEMFNWYGPGALCFYRSPPPQPVLVNNLASAPLLTPCQINGNKLACKVAKISPGVLSVFNDTTPPSSVFLNILDQPGGNQQDPQVTLDANGNGALRFVVTGADDRRADFAELWEVRLVPGGGPSGSSPVTLDHVRLSTLTDVNPDPKIFASSSPSHPHASVPFNGTDPLRRFFFARVYDRAGNFRDSGIKGVRRVTPVVEAGSFIANPATLPPPSGTTTLSWTVSNALTVAIDQGIGDVTAQTINGSGSVQVNVSATRTYTLTATGPNNSTDSRSVTVTVAADTMPPTVTLTANPGTVLAPGTTTLTANATDNVGVTQVEFYRGSTLIGTDTTPGDGFAQAVNFTTADQGNVEFTARAFDAAGNQATSSPINVLVTVPMSADRYVSPTGSDTNPGTQAQPYRTLTRAFAQVGTGGTVWLENGTYTWAAEASAGASQFDFKTRQFPVGRTLRAINPGLATVNFGFAVAGDATIVGVHITSVANDGPGSGGTGVTIGGGASVNAQVQLKGVSFGALSGGSGDGWGAAVMNYCPTCTLTLDTNGIAGFNYIGADFLPGARFITNLGGPVSVNGGTIGSPTLSTLSNGCDGSVFTGHRASFNGVTFSMPATAAGINAPAFCLLGSDPVTLANSTVTQQGSGREYLFMIGFGISGIPGNGNLVLDNSTVTAPGSGVLVALRLAGVRFTATGSSLSGGSRTIGRVGGEGLTNSAITLTGTTVQNVNGTAIEMDGFFVGSTFRMTGGEMKNIQGSALRLASGNLDARLRNVAISNTGISQGDGAVVLFGDHTSIYDLGTAAQPGGNTILGSNATRPGVRVNLSGGGIASAVGNTWVANQQGASSTGTYSGNLVVTSGSGQNYVISGGSLRLSGN